MSYYQALGLLREPFSNSPDPDMLYRAKTHLECLQHMEIAVRLRRGLNVVLGEVGTGKTTLSRELIRLLSQDGDIEVHLLDDPYSPSTTEFLLALARLFQLDAAAIGRDAALLKDALKASLLARSDNGRRIVALVIDEGQKITPECLELLRELLNFETNTHKLLQIVIFAQTEFEAALTDRPNLDDRVNYRYRLLPLDRAQTRRMIETRLALSAPDGQPPAVFTRLALRRIYKLTGGYPRKVVRLCHLSMLLAVGFGRRRIGWGLVGRAARESHGLGRRWFRRMVLAGAAGGLAALCLHFAGPALPGAGQAALDSLGGLRTRLTAGLFAPAPQAVVDAAAVAEAAALAAVPTGTGPVAPGPAAVDAAQAPAVLPGQSAFEEAQGLGGGAPAAAEVPLAAAAPGPAEVPAAAASPAAAVPLYPMPPAEAAAAAPVSKGAFAKPGPAPSQGLGAALSLASAALPPQEAEQIIVVAPESADDPAAAPAVAAPATATPEVLGEITVRPGWAVTRQAARAYGNGGRAVMAHIAKANPGVDFNRVRAGETITFPAIPAPALPPGACLIRVAAVESLEKGFALIGRQSEADPALAMYCTLQPGAGLRFDVVLASLFATRQAAEAALAGLPQPLAAKAVVVDRYPAGTVAFTDLGPWPGRKTAPKLAGPAAPRQLAVREPVPLAMP
ncbi:ExeA family protein [Solidesulfovibrio sp.]